MELAVGAILDGKITGIAKFGAFVSLPGGASGLVHISEIANAYVNDVHDYLSVGQEVRVKVLSITAEGKINLSLKQAQENAPEPAAAPRSAAPRVPRPGMPNGSPAAAGAGALYGSTDDASFEDKLKKFMQTSEGKVNDSKIYADRKGGGRRRK